VSISIIGLIGLIRFRQLSPALRFIEYFILSSVFSGWIENYLARHGIRNLWLFHFNSVIELSLLILAFYRWRTSHWFGKIIVWSFVFYLFCWILGKFTIEPLTGSDKYTSVISKLIQAGLGVSLLFDVLDDSVTLWKNDPRFWVASGIVFYASTSLFLFGLFGVMLEQSRTLLKYLWNINLYAIIISYSFYLRAFFCKPVSTGIIHQSTTIHME
jgi:hypothetical protein